MSDQRSPIWVHIWGCGSHYAGHGPRSGDDERDRGLALRGDDQVGRQRVWEKGVWCQHREEEALPGAGTVHDQVFDLHSCWVCSRTSTVRIANTGGELRSTHEHISSRYAKSKMFYILSLMCEILQGLGKCPSTWPMIHPFASPWWCQSYPGRQPWYWD